ncbi:conserved hypothetical protein [Lebetimonas natsushimae]|uniref:HlyD family secretion protein n=1 Tax=Lebetimonas natsushimae TaxID=1936991 RepID=A0A292YFT5_9BACT|nr:hypothetical protein [Lebetimonas natsushimae]GAX87943.1 conserved hypothetical protein [Lebetimonas natsushimae]
MKKIIIFISALLFAYDAKVVPFDEYDVKAAVSGKVIYANKNLEAKTLKNRTIVKLDDYQEKADINNTITQIDFLKQEILNQEKTVKRKKETYLKYKNLKTKSQIEKDLKFYDYMNSYNQLLNLKQQLSNSISSLKKLKDIVNKKNIKISGYLYKIYINKGDYATPGRLIAKVYDVSKQKLYVYVPIDKIETIKNKKIYINNKLSNFKISKIWKISDEQYITSYKVELTGNGLKFGDIVDVEFKKE